jgi:hypothetical protein
VSDVADFLDEQVDRLRGSVAGTVGVELGQVLPPPNRKGAAEAGDLGHGAVEEPVDEPVCDGSGGDEVAGGIGKAELLGGPPGHGDLAVGVAGGQCDIKAGRGEGESPSARRSNTRRISQSGSPLWPRRPQPGLLNPAPDLVEGHHPQRRDAKGIEHMGRARQVARSAFK